MRLRSRFASSAGEWASVLGLVLVMIAVVALCIVAFSAVVTGIAIFLVIVLVAQASGIPISVKKDGVEIGYLQWFKFHRL